MEVWQYVIIPLVIAALGAGIAIWKTVRKTRYEEREMLRQEANDARDGQLTTLKDVVGLVRVVEDDLKEGREEAKLQSSHRQRLEPLMERIEKHLDQ